MSTNLNLTSLAAVGKTLNLGVDQHNIQTAFTNFVNAAQSGAPTQSVASLAATVSQAIDTYTKDGGSTGVANQLDTYLTSMLGEAGQPNQGERWTDTGNGFNDLLNSPEFTSSQATTTSGGTTPPPGP